MALTKVILDGPMGRKFGKEWMLAVSTPTEALQLIEANTEGFGAWVREKRTQYANYRVTIIDKRGKKMTLDKAHFGLRRSPPAVIRFTPLTQGASAVARMVVGVALMISAIWLGPGAFAAGASLFVGGLIEVLSPTPKLDSGTASDDGTSYYFNGAVQTTAQGVPVPLIIGRCMVGSQPVNVDITIEQLMD